MAANPLADPLVEMLRAVREATLTGQDYRTVYLLTLELLADAQRQIKAQERTIARFYAERRNGDAA